MTSVTIHLAFCHVQHSEHWRHKHDRIVTSTVQHVYIYTSSAAHLFDNWHNSPNRNYLKTLKTFLLLTQLFWILYLGLVIPIWKQ
jgi:hypothetical protein